MFFVDMKAPGIEIRPIQQISGESHFNEVFFTDVRIPDSQRLGAVGDGWKVSLTTLMNERLSVGAACPASASRTSSSWPARSSWTTARPSRTHAVRDKLADWYVRSRASKLHRASAP